MWKVKKCHLEFCNVGSVPAPQTTTWSFLLTMQIWSKKFSLFDPIFWILFMLIMTKQDEQFLEIHSWGIHILLLFLILLVKISRHFKSFTFEAKSQTVDELESHDANVLPTDTSFHLLMRVCCLSILPKNKKKSLRGTLKSSLDLHR